MISQKKKSNKLLNIIKDLQEPVSEATSLVRAIPRVGLVSIPCALQSLFSLTCLATRWPGQFTVECVRYNVDDCA